MNFSERLIMNFRLKGLSERQIRFNIERYYLYVSLILLLFLLTLIFLFFNDLLNSENLSSLTLFFIWFVVILRVFLQLRNQTKIDRFKRFK